MDLTKGNGNDEWNRYFRWKWIIALLLALALLVLWLMGWGPGGSKCASCSAGSAPVAAVAAPATPMAAPIATPAAQNCSVNLEAKAGKLALAGVMKDDAAKKAFSDLATGSFGAGNVADAARVDASAANCPWSAKAGDLFTWLKPKGDVGVNVNGDAAVLTGTVASQAVRDEHGSWAQGFFGANTKIDNQLKIIANKPPAAKVYFETGRFNVDGKARDTMGDVLAYLKANPTSKAIISGFHDPRGNKQANEELAKNRAKSVRDILRAAQIGEDRIEARKPVETTGTGDLREARRVEVSVE
jgi:outer membrane protein OmpA-like peptidoglycan-associated protein